MSDREEKKKLIGPWRNIHGAVWLIGLGILAIKGWWWTGILILIGISGVIEGLLRLYVPEAFEKETTGKPITPGMSMPQSNPMMAPPVEVSSKPTFQEHRVELLPQVCPSCNGPIRGHEVKWTGPQSANCPYCGTNLPMSKA